MGRPSKYTPAIVDAICARLSEGEPLAQICRDDGMPDPATVWRWSEAREDVSQGIARARLLGFDAIAADALRIADTCRLGEKIKTVQGVETERVTSDMVDRARLQVDTRLKLLAKWDPKRYGERVHQTVTGADDGPVQVADASAKLLDALRKLDAK